MDEEWLQTAAQLVVEHGLEMGAAKRQAAKQLGLPTRATTPSNEALLAAIKEYIAIFCAEEQAQALHTLRQLALAWMQRLDSLSSRHGQAPWDVHVVGAVANGTATHWSDIHLHVFCDDPKTAEFTLIDQGIAYDSQSAPTSAAHQSAAQGDGLVLSIYEAHPAWQRHIGVHLHILDRDAVFGTLQGKAGAQRMTRQQLAAALNAAQAGHEGLS